MKEQGKRASRRWRTTAVLAVGVAIGTVMVGTPAGAHVGGTVSHLWGHLKPKADARYLNNNEVRAFGAISDADVDDFTSDTMQTLVSKTFTVPGPGVVLITSSVSAADDASLAGNGSLWYVLQLDGVSTTDAPFPYNLEYGGESSSGDTGSASAVVPVTAGTHTARLVARDDDSGSYIYQKDISILFVRSGSGVPIPARAPASNSANPQ